MASIDFGEGEVDDFIKSPIKVPKKHRHQHTIKAERIAWMSRTSDVLGSHTKKDVESMTTLIRRKIQERCGTTQDLMAAIRRLKSGETGHVTPLEFRYTLVKFGISLAQELSDHIFNIFDSDKSGTIDFDEFAMWIMNSEFRPVKQAAPPPLITPEEELRKRVADCYHKWPEVFANQKKAINFFELICDINRKDMALSEKDARNVFKILDVNDTGSIDTTVMRRWALEGVAERPKGAARPVTVPSVKEAMVRLCGKGNLHVLARAFAHITRGSGVTMKYDEFRRRLLAAGLGTRPVDIQKLFLALGGMKGQASIDMLLDGLDGEDLSVDPAVSCSVKEVKPTMVFYGRADRKLRDAMRKSFKVVKHAIEARDSKGSGFIDQESLNRILNHHCLPLSYEDFRLVIQNIQLDVNNNVNVQHFLHVYNPRVTLHALQASTSLPEFDTLKSFSSSPTSSSGALILEDELNRSGEGFGDISRAQSSDMAALDLRRQWQLAVKSCQKVDPDRRGSVPRQVFISTLQHCVPSMTVEAVTKLADTYCSVEDASVDYNQCFRHFLNDFINSSSKSNGGRGGFKSLEATSVRVAGPVHPWHFDYVKQPKTFSSHKDQETNPYWNRACSTFKASDRASALSEDKLVSGFAKSDIKKGADLTRFDPKAINVCSKIANHQNFKTFKDELKRAQNVHVKGSCTTNNFLAIVDSVGMELTKTDVGVLFRVFRTLGMQDMISFEPLINACLAIKG